MNAGLKDNSPKYTDLLVTTWGRILDSPVTEDDGTVRFHITDGSAAPGVLADAVEVVIPPSVTGTPTISKDDYVRVVGIAGKGLDGAIRAVTIRKAEDLSTIP